MNLKINFAMCRHFLPCAMARHTAKLPFFAVCLSTWHTVKVALFALCLGQGTRQKGCVCHVPSRYGTRQIGCFTGCLPVQFILPGTQYCTRQSVCRVPVNWLMVKKPFAGRWLPCRGRFAVCNTRKDYAMWIMAFAVCLRHTANGQPPVVLESLLQLM